MKKILTVASLILASTIAVAQPHQQFTKQLPLLKSSHVGNGPAYCNIPGELTCMPINNASPVVINYSFEQIPIKDVDIPSNQTRGAYSAYVQVDHDNVTVINKVTQKTIYSGEIDNNIGLTCSATACKAWK